MPPIDLATTAAPAGLLAAIARSSNGAGACHLPPGWDAGWRAAYAARASTPCWLTVFGDSIATGSIAGTTPYENGWVTLLRDALCGGSGLSDLYAEYFPAIQRCGSGSNYDFTDHPWSDWLSGSGTVAYLQTVGYHPAEWTNSTASQAYQTFTCPYAVGAAYLHASHQYSTWGYRVNGGSVQTVTYDGMAFGIRRISLGPLAAGDTVQWGWQGGTQAAIIQGVELVKASAGVGVARFAAGGAKLYDQAGRGVVHYPVDAPALWAGRNPRTGGTLVDFSNGFPTRPHLAVIALGVNDVAASVSVANYAETLDRVISGLRRGRSNTSVLILLYDYFNQDYSDATSRIATPAAAPTVTAQGTPGATTWQVKYAWSSIYGTTAASAAATVANAPASFSGSDFLRVTVPTPLPTAATVMRVYYSSDGGSTWVFDAPTVDQVGDDGVWDQTSTPVTTVTPPSSNGTDLPNYTNWFNYCREALAVAQRHCCGVVSIAARWGGTPLAQGFALPTMTDVHPATAGHADIAAVVEAVLTQ